MVDLISDSDDSVAFEWESDGDAEPSSAPVLRDFDAPGPSTLVRQDTNGRPNGEALPASLVEEYVGMGFPKDMVLKAIKQIGNLSSNNFHFICLVLFAPCVSTDSFAFRSRDANSLVELLLTYKVLAESDASVGNPSSSGCAPHSVENDDDDNLDSEDWDDDDDSDGSSDEDFLQEMSKEDDKAKSLVDMGFPVEEAKMAITRCGADAASIVLVDSIYASQAADSGNVFDHEVSDRSFRSFGERKRAISIEGSKKKAKRYGGGAQGNRTPLDGSDDEMPLPNPMNRRLPVLATAPPFFYYENVARAPKGEWREMSRNLYDIHPEFVDSVHLCAAARKRGYIHNLPIVNRSPILPLPPKTILEAFPHYSKWWPSWDSRKKLNCLQTSGASAKLTERIQLTLANSTNPPPPHVQKYVLNQCKRWNLVWVGKNKVAPLEPHEVEYLLGFPKDHTRGICKKEREKSLGNSFQVDTVAYHLSVLRDKFPNGMNVLSLFIGIGGAEVALHRLGIRLKTVVSVEISPANRRILKGWWDQTQTGTLIEIEDVKTLKSDTIASFVSKYGGFDLVIGGSPCNNLAGSNRHHRVGLEGEHSSLFYHYPRILGDVKRAMDGR
ncbi:hypothetical protein BRADI_1g77873v3 [Brachypodium distachyon]|uniref:DNA (cytosine-5-)-methyltransferase n=1 Tax=Brachypodium distachyon TaxID=15368 RepID=A0A0Q3P203_BRADI|nr:hypothetical protein BRADI_1g77873v3 [Brachypodium distachyon]